LIRLVDSHSFVSGLKLNVEGWNDGVVNFDNLTVSSRDWHQLGPTLAVIVGVTIVTANVPGWGVKRIFVLRSYSARLLHVAAWSVFENAILMKLTFWMISAGECVRVYRIDSKMF
jgi:hypothetical protein